MTAADHAAFCASLVPEESMLVMLRDVLHSGSWDAMLGDLQGRLDGRLYTLQLRRRIQKDIVRIRKLQEYEKKHGVNLGEWLGEAAAPESRPRKPPPARRKKGKGKR